MRCIFVYGAFPLAALMTTACSKEQTGEGEPGEALPVRAEGDTFPGRQDGRHLGAYRGLGRIAVLS